MQVFKSLIWWHSCQADTIC